jgi:hypothetical protein
LDFLYAAIFPSQSVLTDNPIFRRIRSREE